MTTEDVKQLTGQYENLDNKVVEPLISVVEVGYIKPLLGKQLYDYITSLPDTDSTKILMKRAWAYKVIANLFQTQFLKVTNRGVEKKVATSNSLESSQGEVAVMVRFYTSTADSLSQALITAVNEDPTLTAYYKAEDGVKGIKPSSIYFPDNKYFLQ